MTKENVIITVSAIALLVSMAATSVAQAPAGAAAGGTQEQQKAKPGDGDRNRGSSEQGTTEQPKGRSGSPQRDSATRPNAPDRAEDKASPRSRTQGQDGTPKAAERAQENASPKSTIQGQKADDNDIRRNSAGDNNGKDSTKQSEKVQTKDRDQSAGDATKAKPGDRERSERSDGDRRGNENAQGGADRSSERVQLSDEKRSSVRERMSKSARSNRVTSVNFDIRVGVNVPRSTTFHVLPPNVIEIVPEYRGYRYVYVRDEIVIIHPTNYVVVAVIGGDGRVGARSGSRITLASDDRIFVRQHIDLGANVRLGIGNVSIGMDLPDSVKLRVLPDVVAQRYPDLRGHRYFVYEQDVVIVGPQSRLVVMVIEH